MRTATKNEERRSARARRGVIAGCPGDKTVIETRRPRGRTPDSAADYSSRLASIRHGLSLGARRCRRRCRLSRLTTLALFVSADRMEIEAAPGSRIAPAHRRRGYPIS